jgi:hypothetical protein
MIRSLAMPQLHLALLGDSIFDNAAYTAGAPDVIAHVRALLPARGVDVIDLRLVCTEPSDYANPIEPSGAGGRKIAAAIAAAIGVAERPAGARVFGR